MTTLHEFRSGKDHFFATDPHSPLTPQQQQAFRGLRYFPPNADLRLEVSVELLDSAEIIQIPTSTGDFQAYTRYGRFTFNINGQEATLTLYRDEDEFFLPFVDALAGSETYPAGRYLEVEQLTNGKFVVDFNMAYNPYCAYNPYWSCPLTPFENRLKVPIRAGEKIFSEEVANI